MNNQQENDSKPGKRLATLARKEGEELRVELREFKGHQFLDIRIFWQNEEEQWRPGKGTTVKIRELTEVRDALTKAIDLTSQQNGPRATAR